jgi:hypothetical protein
MNIKTIGAKTLFALAGAVCFVPTTAEAALPYNDGDLFLSFRATGGLGAGTDYVVNLGNISQFLSATSVITLSGIGNIDADLDVIYPDWSTRADVLFSVSGTQFVGANGLANRTLLASAAQNTPLTIGFQNSAAWNRGSLPTFSPVALKMQAMGTRYGLGDGDASPTASTESSNSPFALIQPTTEPNSYRSFMPGGLNTTGATAFGYFGGANGIEGNFGFGAPGVALDFYVVQPGTGPSDFIGNFTITDTGAVTFTPEGVPEPATVAMLGLGAAVLGFFRRRQQPVR